MKRICFKQIIALSLLLIPIVVGAQTINTLSGSVVDANNKLVVGNVLALSVKDSSLINGTSFFEEPFKITGLNEAEVLLKLISLQFEDTIIHVKYNGSSTIDLGTVRVNEASVNLNEVEVVGQAPLFVNKPNGAIEINVANTILATSTSVNEILSKSPNVLVSEAGVSVFGKGEAILYLNGTRITDERLSSISASQVKKIEILSNPSSKYDAEGKSVINIITVMNFEEGYNGVLSQFITMSSFSDPSTNTNIDVNYKKRKLSLKGSYGLMLGNNREVLNTTRTRQEERENFYSNVMMDWKRKYNNFSNYSVGGQYNFNEKSNISTEYNGFFNNLGGLIKSTNAITSNEMDGLFRSGIEKDEVTDNNSITVNYNNKIDTLGSSLFVGAQYSHFNSKTDDYINENSIINDEESFRVLNNKVGLKIAVTSTQIDYSKAFNLNSKLDLGVKFSYVENVSNSDFFVSENGEGFVYDNERSTDFDYREKVPAGYISYARSISSKTSYGIGLRSEWTSYQLTTYVQEHEVIEDDYVNFFPNAFVTTKISEKVELTASYSSRITRPKYQALNPSVIYQDAFTTIEGNPNLQPEKTHALEVGATYIDYSFKIGYNYAIDPMSAAALQGDDENSYVLKAINLSEGHTYFASLSIPINYNWWSSMNTINVSYNKLISDDGLFSPMESRPQLYLYSSNKFDINNLFKLQLLVSYSGDRYDGIYFRKSRSFVTLGIERSFFNKSLTLKLIANDIFHRDKPAGNYEVGQTFVEFDRVYNTNYFRFGLTYDFGRLKKTSYKNKSPGKSENERAQ